MEGHFLTLVALACGVGALALGTLALRRGAVWIAEPSFPSKYYQLKNADHTYNTEAYSVYEATSADYYTRSRRSMMTEDGQATGDEIGFAIHRNYNKAGTRVLVDEEMTIYDSGYNVLLRAYTSMSVPLGDPANPPEEFTAGDKHYYVVSTAAKEYHGCTSVVVTALVGDQMSRRVDFSAAVQQ